MPPDLIDEQALPHRRRRIRPDALFLHARAAAEAKERLAEVNRRFTAPAIVTPAPAPWAAAFPGARLLPPAPVLDLQPRAHDLVIHALSLHSANDPVGQIIQCRNALIPDGLFLAVLFGGRSLHELRAVLATAEAEVTGGLSPRVLPMAELRDWGGLVQRAGLALPVADSDTLPVTYPDLFALLRDLRHMGEANPLAARLRRFTRRGLFDRAARLYARHHAAPDGRLRATVEMIWLTGWAPGDGQPQPARPGSARMRLADALGTREIGLNDPAPRPQAPEDDTE